ncbi:MAG: hypothetical protein CME65_05510 [Halobacteriovoraceae bacterium]|nr:hypothetical protein [Halobacteriovoraceae bacterium]|tara:strand:+ start:11684 stop:12643 length:960 start_codon:yes stop_codon:yes gene_type:complete
MSFKLKLFISPWRDPFRNLAFEDQLLKTIRPSEKYLLVYQNDPCVVMGRFQNPWREVNLEFLENNQSHLKLVRRQSGGGCVYHDLGNMCFSFIHPSRDHHKDDNNKIILNALEDLGIKAKASNRSDLILEDERKFSGSAFKQKKDRSFHHGTLLMNSDLSLLNDILNSPLKSLEGKGTLSNPSKVVNLAELNPSLQFQKLGGFLTSSFENFYGKKVELGKNDFNNKEYEDSLREEEWIFGETPEFQVSTPDFNLKIKKARLVEVEFPQLSGGVVELLKTKLVGQIVKKDALEKTMESAYKVFSHPYLFQLEQNLRTYFY